MLNGAILSRFYPFHTTQTPNFAKKISMLHFRCFFQSLLITSALLVACSPDEPQPAPQSEPAPQQQPPQPQINTEWEGEENFTF